LEEIKYYEIFEQKKKGRRCLFFDSVLRKLETKTLTIYNTKTKHESIYNKECARRSVKLEQGAAAE
jgi:hypothetical protein